MTLPLVSIIIPTHDRPIRLNRAIESVQVQTYENVEAVVVNDAGKPVDEIVKQFSRARLINHPKNRGLPAARNTGIRAARGGYLGYLDDDDWLYPDHVKTCMDYLLANKARWVYSNSDALFPSGRIRLYMYIDYTGIDGICQRNITPVCCVMHERSLLAASGMFDETLPNHEDWDLWIRFAMIAPPYHINRITCCIDRAHLSMINNKPEMVKGYKFIRERYKNRRENSSLLPA